MRPPLHHYGTGTPDICQLASFFTRLPIRAWPEPGRYTTGLTVAVFALWFTQVCSYTLKYIFSVFSCPKAQELFTLGGAQNKPWSQVPHALLPHYTSLQFCREWNSTSPWLVGFHRKLTLPHQRRDKTRKRAHKIQSPNFRVQGAGRQCTSTLNRPFRYLLHCIYVNSEMYFLRFSTVSADTNDFQLLCWFADSMEQLVRHAKK